MAVWADPATPVSCCPVPPRRDRRGPCLPAGRKGHNHKTLFPSREARPVAGELHFVVPETTYDMIIDHAHCLHEGVTNRRPNELEPSFPQILAHRLGRRRA